MTWNKIEGVQTSDTASFGNGENHIALRAGIYDGTTPSVFVSTNDGNKHLLGKGVLPDIGLTGFNQETDESTGLKRLWHKVEHIFSHAETLNDQVKDKVMKKMTPEETKRYDEENKKIADFDKEVRRWSTLMTLNPPPFPEAPNCPMHEEVQRRVQQAEQKIADDVRAHMTPAEKERLDKQMKEYEDGVKEARTIHNPMGTGEGFKPLPEPGDAVKDYWYRIKVATEAEVKRS